MKSYIPKEILPMCMDFLLKVAKTSDFKEENLEAKLTKKFEDNPQMFEFMFENLGQLCSTPISKKQMAMAFDQLLNSETPMEAVQKATKMNEDTWKEHDEYVAKFQKLAKLDKVKFVIELLKKIGEDPADHFNELMDKCEKDEKFFNEFCYAFDYICNDGNHQEKELKIKYKILLDSDSLEEASKKMLEFVKNNPTI